MIFSVSTNAAASAYWTVIYAQMLAIGIRIVRRVRVHAGRKMMADNVLYMEVTRDKYELPVAVAGSAIELGRMVGVKGHNILCAIDHTRKRGGRCKYIKVVLEDEEDGN